MLSIGETQETLSHVTAIPGQVGLEHRIGGLEKGEDGGVSYDPDNHEEMSHFRAQKVAGIAKSLDPIEIQGEPEGDLISYRVGRNLWCDFIRSQQFKG